MTTQTPEIKPQNPGSIQSEGEITLATSLPKMEDVEGAKNAEKKNKSGPETEEFGKPLQRPAGRTLASSLANSVGGEDGPRTQLVRGGQKMARGEFRQDPVVGWLVVIGGPGLGAFRPIFEGNNTVGRSENQRIPVNFGDDAISSEEQVYIRYDSSERRFLFVPNLAKTNVVSLNDEKPTAAVELEAMDVITVGRTQLVFVPFCGNEFDWSELAELE